MLIGQAGLGIDSVALLAVGWLLPPVCSAFQLCFLERPREAKKSVVCSLGAGSIRHP